MIKNIKMKLTSDNVVVRIVFTYMAFLVIFVAVTILSYYFLPEGFLRNKNPLKNVRPLKIRGQFSLGYSAKL